MKSTSIFVNQNPSFDHYFAEMRKRNMQKGYMTNQTGFISIKSGKPTPDSVDRRKSYTATSSLLNRSPQKAPDAQFELESQPELRPLERNPMPRDGHAAVILYNSLFIFGGDRHRMSFNDLNILSLAQHI